jgi:CheY-like chemotaxis protein
MVILLDINMPLMNGFEFLETLSTLQTVEQGTSVVVMLTSSSFNGDRARALEFSMVKDYIVKPLGKQRARELADKFGSAADAS